MSDRDASQTALATAYLRAAHQVLDAKPCLLDDAIALKLLGKDAARRIQDTAQRYLAPEALALRSHIVLRSRFAEDQLSAAVRRGVSQYVIVGAGFDTFALRQPEWASSLTVIEVDHLGSQTAKRARIAEAGLEVPTNVIFADIDFEKESLADGLLRHGVATTKPTFFSWLGVTMYLTEAAIDEVLRSIARFPEGSEVVLTFMQPPPTVPDISQAGATRIAQLVAAAGERFVSHFVPEILEAKLIEAGFSRVEFLTPEIASATYFEQCQTNLPPPKRITIASAFR